MLSSGNDIISVKSDDLNHVFNEVLLAFDFYNGIERRLAAAPFKPNPEQEVLSACESLIGPTHLMRKDYVIMARSMNYGLGEVNQFWDSFIMEGAPRLEALTFMRSSVTSTKILSGKPSMQEFFEPMAHPYSYGLACTYLRSDGGVIGHLIIASDHAITPFEHDIAAIMMEALRAVQLNLHVASTTEAVAADGDVLLANLIGRRLVPRSAAALEALFALPRESRFRLVCVEPREKDYPTVLRATLKKSFGDCAVTEIDGRFYVLCWGTPAGKDRLAQIHDELRQKASFAFGISNAFVGLENVPDIAGLCEYTLETDVDFFSDCAVDYLLHGTDRQLRMLARHPLAIALERTDEQRGTSLTPTMREYLLCERSVKQAAGRLFIHKNTVLYRVEQALKLAECDFDDRDERVYLLISLLL